MRDTFTIMNEIIAFGRVTAPFVLRVCEALFALTNPRDKENIVLGGVHLRLYVTSHWAGFERYMLIGQGWTCGFNLRPPEADSLPENIFSAFETKLEMFTPHLSGERNFMRDMTILTMTEHDWSDD
jgi:hypothetical protein